MGQDFYINNTPYGSIRTPLAFQFTTSTPPPKVDAGPYDSRSSSIKGVGFPSASRELARVPPNTRDANGYYEELGIYPWASKSEIKKDYLEKCKIYHPDWGTHPNPDKFARLTEIYETLRDDVTRAQYDATPQGSLFVDSVVKEDLLRKARARGENVMSPEAKAMFEEDLETTVDDDDQPNRKSRRHNEQATKSRTAVGYDFFADKLVDGDHDLAQRWYEVLLRVSPVVGYSKTIKVLLTASHKPFWKDGSQIIAIPRRWTPTEANAFALLHVVVPVTARKWNIRQRMARAVENRRRII